MNYDTNWNIKVNNKKCKNQLSFVPGFYLLEISEHFDLKYDFH